MTKLMPRHCDGYDDDKNDNNGDTVFVVMEVAMVNKHNCHSSNLSISPSIQTITWYCQLPADARHDAVEELS